MCYCLAVSGSMLLCGGDCKDGRTGFVVVLGSECMGCQHTLRLSQTHYVQRLLSVRGEVWSILGNGNVAVWGKEGRRRDRA